MTQEEKTIKLAEVDGWTSGEANVNRDHSKAKGFWYKNMFYIGYTRLPNYFNDSNTLQNLKDSLSYSNRIKYLETLKDAFLKINPQANGWELWWDISNPSPELQAETLGKVLNLW
jgi:hypothetical protein